MATNEELIATARSIIASEGTINLHDLVHKIATELDCFGEINGTILESLQIANNEYPMYVKTNLGYTYIAEEPVIEGEF